MLRYFAFLWNAASARQSADVLHHRMQLSDRSGWHSVLEREGSFIAWTDNQHPALRCHRLDNQAGVILGSLFERSTDLLDDSPTPRAQLGAEESRAIVQSEGRQLIERYWGNYVAFILDDQSSCIIVSPTGSLPCLVTQVESITWVYSYLADALALGLPTPTRCRTYLHERLLGRPIGSANPLHQIMRLLRGEALRLHPSAHPPRIERRTIWDPHAFSARDQDIDDPTLAARAMRNVVRSCTHTLAADHPHLQLRLSGGLDSSIIAGCLRSATARTTCHTYFSLGTSADARPWARLAATHGGYPLTEHAIDPGTLALPPHVWLAPSPDVPSLLEYLFRTQLERQLCRQHDATAVFTGDGGDAGFCSDCVALAVIDYLRRHGMAPRIWSLSQQVALATHRTTWQVLARTLRHRFGHLKIPHPFEVDAGETQLVSPDLAREAPPPLQHPWFHTGDDTAWLTFFRLGGLVIPSSFYDLSIAPDDFAPEIVQPLYAQPVVELLLRIPLHLHFEAGRDRGLARRAFAQDASAPNLQRLWKDRAPGFLSDLVRSNASRIREILLDGVLADARLLDRRAVESALSTAPSRNTVNPAEIVRHLDIEIWARHFKGA